MLRTNKTDIHFKKYISLRTNLCEWTLRFDFRIESFRNHHGHTAFKVQNHFSLCAFKINHRYYSSDHKFRSRVQITSTTKYSDTIFAPGKKKQKNILIINLSGSSVHLCINVEIYIFLIIHAVVGVAVYNWMYVVILYIILINSLHLFKYFRISSS